MIKFIFATRWLLNFNLNYVNVAVQNSQGSGFTETITHAIDKRRSNKSRINKISQLMSYDQEQRKVICVLVTSTVNLSGMAERVVLYSLW